MNSSSFTKCMALAVGLAIFTMPAQATEVEGTKFSKTYISEGKNLRLIGAGLLRYWGFRAYTGALYIEEGTPADQVLTDTAKRIEIEYFRAIKGEDFGPATGRAIDEVDSGRCQGLFFLSATPIADVEAVAAAGEKMPQKSTYFFPKVFSGLVINMIDQV